MDKKYVTVSLGYGLLGLILGIYMAASHDHSQSITHAHILLLGFIISFIYGVIHKIWLPETTGRIVVFQYYAHVIGTLVLIAGLFLLKGLFVEESVLEPFLALGSLSVLFALIAMKIMFLKSYKKA